LERARRVLGGFDLDPASCPEANEQVQAERYFTRAQDGLAQDWYGRIWLNPPYGRGRANHRAFVATLLREYHAGHVHAAILLVRSATAEQWFQPLWDFPICFVRGRVRFISPDGMHPRSSNTQGTALVSIGNDPDRFTENFSDVGTVYVPR
ncbi:MAG: hypothetical protein HC911_16040, partial [Chloroflexaceae bacterium]|nr:hypothetical protein [Chloroflexaceae bacterium]